MALRAQGQGCLPGLQTAGAVLLSEHTKSRTRGLERIVCRPGRSIRRTLRVLKNAAPTSSPSCGRSASEKPGRAFPVGGVSTSSAASRGTVSVTPLCGRNFLAIFGVSVAGAHSRPYRRCSRQLPRSEESLGNSHRFWGRLHCRRLPGLAEHHRVCFLGRWVGGDVPAPRVSPETGPGQGSCFAPQTSSPV